MSAPLIMVLASDAECLRTLRTAFLGIARVVETPPQKEAFVLVADAQSLAGKAFSTPPCRAIGLGAPVSHALADTCPVDWIPVPFHLRELVSRLSALLASPPPCPRLLMPGCPLQLDTVTRQLIHTETSHYQELTEKETLLLHALVKGEGAPISRETLLAEVWAYQPDIPTRTLETHLSRLRGKLQHFPTAQIAILPDEGGYRLALSR